MVLFRHLNRWFERDDPLIDPERLLILYDSPLEQSAANQLAKQWIATYQDSNSEDRALLLGALAHAYALSTTDTSAVTRLFRRLYTQSNDLALMLKLRADMLQGRADTPELNQLEPALAALLLNWFEIGMLDLRPITWDSPASLLERLIRYEAVHEIQSWDDMKRRVAADRRCYAFFHPQLPEVPLIFVEVALAEKMAHSIQAVIDPAQPVIEQPTKARWAIFYSISNTQRGLRGISFGGFLLKRVIDVLLAELPSLRSFATLSPIPDFTKWLSSQSAADLQTILYQDKPPAASALTGSGKEWIEQLQLAALQADTQWEKVGLRLMAHYLCLLPQGQAVDPVARFHLGNGASLGRINWAADTSAKGLKQSCGMMVNYRYETAKLDTNRQLLATGHVKVSREVQRLN